MKETIETSKLTIEDIIKACDSANIKCENCIFWLNTSNEKLNWSNCIYDYSIRSETPKETHFDHFCKGFKPKDK